jgi:hypothetical protein
MSHSPPFMTRYGTSTPLVGPVIEAVTALPAGTSAPSTVITEHAVHEPAARGT